MRMIHCAAGVTLLMLTVAGCADTELDSSGSGLLETTDVLVSSETSGRITSIGFDEGTTIARGDTLLTIDASRIELQLAAAEAGRQAAAATLETTRLQLKQAGLSESYAATERDRVTGLLQSGTGTQRQFDRVVYEHDQAVVGRQTARAQVTAGEAELTRIDAEIDNLRRSLEDCYPLSPTGGTVTEKYVEVGELVSPGRALARISRTDSLWVKLYLPAADFAAVAIGDPATIDTETGGRQFPGQVVWTSAEAEFTPKNVQTAKSRANLVYAVKVKMANPDGLLKAGMPVFVTLDK